MLVAIASQKFQILIKKKVAHLDRFNLHKFIFFILASNRHCCDPSRISFLSSGSNKASICFMVIQQMCPILSDPKAFQVIGETQFIFYIWKCLTSTFASIWSFWKKLILKLNVLCTGVFETLPGRVQCEMLLKVTEQCFNTLERSEMLLLLLRRFPETVVQHGVRCESFPFS